MGVGAIAFSQFYLHSEKSLRERTKRKQFDPFWSKFRVDTFPEGTCCPLCRVTNIVSLGGIVYQMYPVLLEITTADFKTFN